MKAAKLGLVALLLCGCLGPFARQSWADATELTFGMKDGGTQDSIGTGTLSAPYASVTLTLVGNTIIVSGTAGPDDADGLSFFDQSSSTGGFGGEGGIFGFAPAAGTVSLLAGSCSINSGPALSASQCAINPAAGNTGYDGYGSFADSVDIITGTPVYNASGTPLKQTQVGYAFSTFSFTLQDTLDPFTSVNQIINPSSGGITDIASHVCETATGSDSSNGCEDPAQATSSTIYATYVGLTPEPGSYLLFGSGLLVLGIILRKRLGTGRAA